MAFSYGISVPQTIAPNQPFVWTSGNYAVFNGLIYQKSGGVFLLASNAPESTCRCTCGCRRLYTTDYEVEVHANILIPTGGTVEEIRLAIAVDGVIDPESIMSFVPAAVETAGNVGTSIIVSVPSICGCDNVAVVNASTQDITVNNASLVFDYAGVQRIR